MYNVAGWAYTPKPTEIEHPTIAFVTTSFLFLVVIPLLVIWFRALWNEILPRVTSWRNISYMEAFGLFTIVMLLSTDL
jgi:hypothetical protein